MRADIKERIAMIERGEVPEGYKKTDLGGLPVEWNAVPIASVGSVITGNTPDTTDIDNYGNEFLFVSPGDISDRKYIVNSEKQLSAKGMQCARKIPSESILMTCIGSTIGKIAKAKNELATNQQINAVICYSGYDSDFVYYCIDYYFNLGKKRLIEGQAVPIINKTKFSEVIIPSTKYSEQIKIAAILSIWDRAIQLKENLLEQKKLQKKGLMERLLTGKVRVPGFNYEWKKKRIKELLVLRERPIQLNDDMQYEQITIRRNYGGVESRGSSLGRTILVTSQFLVRQNDFVISRRQIAHGACGVVPLELDGSIVSNEYDVFTACADLDVHFFSYLMQLPIFKYKFYVYSNGVHIEKMIFHTNAWLKVEIKLPDYEEQVRIREIIDKRQMEIDLLNQEITQLKLQKKGLMQLLLTGKIRVTDGGA